MATRKPIPDPSVPLVDPTTGRMTKDWYDYFKINDALGLGGLFNVSATEPANDQVLIYNATTRKWTPGGN
jgi:hypothetical protein